jgi:hypothetical protein
LASDGSFFVCIRDALLSDFFLTMNKPFVVKSQDFFGAAKPRLVSIWCLSFVSFYLWWLELVLQ